MSDLARVYQALRQSQPEVARQLIDPLLRRSPDDPEVHRAAAAVAQMSGRIDDAIRSMRTAVRLAPRSTPLLMAFGRVLASVGDVAEATVCFRQVTALQPDSAEAWYLLGMMHERVDALTEALVAFERAYALAPTQPQLLQALAEAEYLLERNERALPRFERLTALAPDDPGLQLRLAQCRRRCGQPDIALTGVLAALARFPDDAALWFERGWIHEDLGDAAQAQAAYARARALAPAWTDPVACAIVLACGEAPDELVNAAQDMLSSPTATALQKAFLHHALGKREDQRGDYAAAAAHWSAANALRRQLDGGFDREAHSARIDARIAAASPAFARRTGVAASDDPRPLFVVGMPRSGTTLVEQVIAAHPSAHGCGELFAVMQAAQALADDLDRDDPAALRSTAAAWLGVAARNAPSDALRLVDKMPYNYLHLDLIARLFANARVVWCRRDPRDTALSIYSESFAPWATYATDLDDIRFAIGEQERLMRHWQAVLPLPILEVRYEAMVADSEAQFRRLIDFAGLPWDARCLDFHAQGRAVQTHSRWQVRQPVNSRSVGRWRHYPQWFGPADP